MFTILNISRCLTRLLSQVSHQHHQTVCFESTSSYKYDHDVVKKVKEQIERDKIYKDVHVADFSELYENHDDNGNDSTKLRIKNIINFYDRLKYDLEDVPSSISLNDMKSLLECDTINSLRRQLSKFHLKETKTALTKELKRLYPNTSKTDNKIIQNGIFDKNNNLIYGLWRNTMFTRIPKSSNSRFWKDRLKNAELFGQNIVIDMSFSSQLSHILSHTAADDLGKFLIHNRNQLSEPFKITLCGVDYDSYLWKFLKQSYGICLEWTEHTPEQYIDKYRHIKSELVYIHGMKNEHFLEYDPCSTYVMPAVPERDLNHDFLSPVIAKHNVRCVNIPIDQNILWNLGSKRLRLLTRLKLINDIRDNVSWKETLLRHIPASNLKTEEQILEEQQYRLKRWEEQQIVTQK